MFLELRIQEERNSPDRILHDVILHDMREKNAGLSNQNVRESDYSDKSGRFHWGWGCKLDYQWEGTRITPGCMSWGYMITDRLTKEYSGLNIPWGKLRINLLSRLDLDHKGLIRFLFLCQMLAEILIWSLTWHELTFNIIWPVWIKYSKKTQLSLAIDHLGSSGKKENK